MIKLIKKLLGIKTTEEKKDLLKDRLNGCINFKREEEDK